MKIHKKQSRQPRPQTPERLIERFKRDFAKAGFQADVTYGNGRYAPSVTLSVWPKEEGLNK